MTFRRIGKGKSREEKCLWLCLCAALLISICFIALKGRKYLDSDMASEMILANLLNQEGGVLSKNWFYSTELRVFCLQPFYRVGLLIQPHDWYMARVIGQTLCLIATIVSYLYMGHQLGLRYNGLLSAIAFACPFGTWYLLYGIYGGYYLPHMMLLMLCFGLFLALRKENKHGRKILQESLFVMLCLVSGLNGVKSIMALFAPLLMASAVLFVQQLHVEGYKRSELQCLINSGIGFLAGGAGYIVNSKIFTTQYHFPDYTTYAWGTISLASIFDSWSSLLGLFGFQTDSSWQTLPEVFSIRGLLGLFGLVMAAVLIFSAIRLFTQWKNLQYATKILVLTFTMDVVLQGFMFETFGGGLFKGPRYWLTCIPLAFAVIHSEIENEKYRYPVARVVASAGFLFCIACTSAASILTFMKCPLLAKTELKPLCDWVVEHGYTQGYATFWNGNVLTEWSNNQLEMWVVDNLKDLELKQWLQYTSHEEPPTGEIVLVTDKGELENAGLQALYGAENMVYENHNGFLVFTYDNYEQMKEQLQAAESMAQ